MASLLSKRLAGEPVSKVEIHVSCDKLMNKDVTSKSDPCCLLYMMTSGKWLEVSVCFLHVVTSCLLNNMFMWSVKMWYCGGDFTG